jgi:hypothetical protein
MILSLESAVEKLIELNLVSREVVEKRKAEKHFGKKSCHILRKFQKAVRENSSNFFTGEPCLKIFDQKARALFKKGGSQFFPPKNPRSLPRKRSNPESPVESPQKKRMALENDLVKKLGEVDLPAIPEPSEEDLVLINSIFSDEQDEVIVEIAGEECKKSDLATLRGKY